MKMAKKLPYDKTKVHEVTLERALKLVHITPTTLHNSD
jgi:hypothetical protein